MSEKHKEAALAAGVFCWAHGEFFNPGERFSNGAGFELGLARAMLRAGHKTLGVRSNTGHSRSPTRVG